MGAAIKPEIFISWIPDGKVNIAPKIYISVVYVPHVEKATADTLRNISKLETFSADTQRKIGNTESTRADLNRKVKNLEKAIADTARKMGVVTITADTCRVVKNLDIASADSLRKIGVTETVQADSLRKVAVFEKISADTQRKINATEKAIADTCRRMLERATADSLRKVTRPEKATADTVIRYPHVLNYLPQNSIVNSFKDYDLTNFEVTLNERTLSDSFTIETARQFNINDAVKGTFLDYPFSFLVEETTEKDLFYTVNGMYDIDKLLYSFIQADMRDEEQKVLNGEGYYKASSYVSKIAEYFGLTANIKIADFIPYNVIGDTNITYSDLISSLFSWTSRLPQRQINVFIRGDNLHCIQRGKEDSVFDISNIPHSRPTVNKKLLRSMYNSPFDDISEETKNIPFSGIITYRDEASYNMLHYSMGLLVKEKSYSHTSNKEASYDYMTIGVGDNAVSYLRHKKVTTTTYEDSNSNKTVISAETKYIYSFDNSTDDIGDIYLRKETESNTKMEFSSGYLVDEEKNIRETFHSPLGNGFYSTTVYENGEHQGSTISQGKPSNEVSPYTIEKVYKSFGKSMKDDNYEARRSRLAPIADTSFPVRELDLLKELTEDLKWLNRKIQVTVTIDLIDRIQNGVPTLNHVVDFTERVKLDGVEYFLVSNNISFTPRKLIQRLQLVRWEE